MKFVCEDRRTRTLLSEWAGEQKVIIASHYFWSAGTTIQKSQDGLLRTLLFQIMVHVPDLISLICPDRWSEDSPIPHFYLNPWGRSELLQALENLAKIKSPPAKICLFIDGLDEYDGDHTDIICIVNILAQSPHIKLCVSSRPWTVFIDAFSGLPWKLYVQDLTQRDIRLYIKDNLEEDPRFLELKKREAIGSERLVQQIIEKAQGVFLWVYLVVRSLLRGLTNSDDMSDLELRLAKLPGHLESYFKHMLNTIEDVYQQHTARTFRIMLCAGSSLPLIALHFIDQERQNPNYALQHEIQSVPVQKVMDIVVVKTRQLNAHCKDLLEVTLDSTEHPLFSYKVGFLHRTVIDFLRTGDMVNLMSKRAGSDFSPDASLCRAYLAQVKALPQDFDYVSQPSVLRNLVFGALRHAKMIEITRELTEVELLDELDRSVTIFGHKATIDKRSANNPWKFIFAKNGCNTLIEIAVRAGLHIYVERKLGEHGRSRAGQYLLMSHALRRSISLQTSEICGDYKLDLKMLRLLLESGASPESANIDIGAKAFWDFLENYVLDMKRESQQGIGNILEACEVLLEYGTGGGNAHVSERGWKLIKKCFTDKEVRRLERTYKSVQRPAWWKSWYIFSDHS